MRCPQWRSRRRRPERTCRDSSPYATQEIHRQPVAWALAVNASPIVPRWLDDRLNRAAEGYRNIYVILAPPRTGSTALARVFWNHEDIGFYANEPFELSYHRKLPTETACEPIERPLDLGQLMASRSRGNSLLIKEMTYQVGASAPALIAIATRPIVFLIRDPRLSIWSRMRMVGGGKRFVPFPVRESGWDDLVLQVAYCRDNGVNYTILDASDMRRYPDLILESLFARLALEYSPEFRVWMPLEVGSEWIGRLGGYWYARVLGSSGVEPPTERVPDVGRFPVQHGLRAHVELCLEMYKQLCRDSGFIALVH
jgi:hypothetical protein